MPRQDQSATIERRRQTWLKVQARGKQRFIFTRGVLAYGIGTFIVEHLAFALYDLHSHRAYTLPSPESMLAQVIAFCIVGYFYGIWFWNWNERKFG
jgi:hypothetical protein